MYSNFKIVVCTYKRYDVFKEKTYQMLLDNNIDVEKHLFVVFANEEEKNQYDTRGIKYNTSIIGDVGRHNALRAAINHFEIGEHLFFLDDDIEYFFEFNGLPSKGNLVKPSSNLIAYLEDGFESGYETFTFKSMQNYYFVNKKPWKEFRPSFIVGGFFGAKNHPMLDVGHGHLDDAHRTCRYINKFGGTLIYNWAGFRATYGKNDGGMQSSGDRGPGGVKDLDWLQERCEEIYRDNPTIQMYCKPPSYNPQGDVWDIQLKPISSLKKYVHFDNKQWSNYFQETEND